MRVGGRDGSGAKDWVEGGGLRVEDEVVRRVIGHL